MATERLTADRNAAYVSDSPAAYEMVKGTIVVAGGAGAGTLTLYGPPVGGNVTTPTVASTAIGSMRPGYRMAIMRITGSDNSAAAGTRDATIWTFKTITITGTTGTVGGIIGRYTTVVDISVSGAVPGWVVRDAVADVPLVVSDPGCGIQIVLAAAGSNGNIPCEILVKMVPIKTPST